MKSHEIPLNSMKSHEIPLNSQEIPFPWLGKKDMSTGHEKSTAPRTASRPEIHGDDRRLREARSPAAGR